MAVMIPPKTLRLRYSVEGGWVVNVPWLMPVGFVRGVARWAVKRQKDRYRACPPGEKKDQLKVAIERLMRCEIEQNVVGTRGDGTGDLLIFAGKRN